MTLTPRNVWIVSGVPGSPTEEIAGALFARGMAKHLITIFLEQGDSYAESLASFIGIIEHGNNVIVCGPFLNRIDIDPFIDIAKALEYNVIEIVTKQTEDPSCYSPADIKKMQLQLNDRLYDWALNT